MCIDNTDHVLFASIAPPDWSPTLRGIHSSRGSLNATTEVPSNDLSEWFVPIFWTYVLPFFLPLTLDRDPVLHFKTCGSEKTVNGRISLALLSTVSLEKYRVLSFWPKQWTSNWFYIFRAWVKERVFCMLTGLHAGTCFDTLSSFHTLMSNDLLHFFKCQSSRFGLLCLEKLYKPIYVTPMALICAVFNYAS